ncbi:MAG: type II toxin-antitoxin system Phd/YefM family antitoxin [Ornithinimicrobium sp.]|jgi:prevent-host-death family protein|uniref:type II toxin-antitoxin system Phd/YefM family antitoxin n=1 Tax=Ornithinimicrobium sp. TaxID=1977084 RepID=UPI003D9AC503
MKTISHRELRNDSSAVLREVGHGESFQVTNRGEVVATLVPARVAADLRCVRPAKGSRLSEMTRHAIDEPSATTLAELRGER